MRVLLHSAPWDRERNVQGPCLTPESPEGRRKLVQRVHFSAIPLLSPGGFQAGQGLEEMGTGSPQFQPAAEGIRSQGASHRIPQLHSQEVPEFAPGLSLPYRPFSVSAL